MTRPGPIARPACLLVLLLIVSVDAALAQGDARRGLYLSKAAGCAGCHTSEAQGSPPFAGGRVLKTPFGTFFGPNITPHPDAGIGKWSEADFRRAIREGMRPDGAHYFPSFPYPSFTGMSDTDMRDLWAYLRTLPPSDRRSQPHDLKFPFGFRFLAGAWKWFFFTPGPFAPDARASAQVNRGAYLAGSLGHCGECHTPRNFLGGTKKARLLAGGELPEGEVPNITPTNLKKWNDRDLASFFKDGTTPTGDVSSDVMLEVITNTTSQLTAEDVAALIAYLRTVPALPDEPKKKK